VAWRVKHCWGRWLLDHPVKPDDDNLGTEACLTITACPPPYVSFLLFARTSVRTSVHGLAHCWSQCLLCHAGETGMGLPPGRVEPGDNKTRRDGMLMGWHGNVAGWKNGKRIRVPPV
jgi:hypothetical protein